MELHLRDSLPAVFQLAAWSLASLPQRFVKHARYYWLMLAEGHLTRRLFGAMVRRIAALPPTGLGGACAAEFSKGEGTKGRCQWNSRRGETCLFGKFGGCGKMFQIAYIEAFRTEAPIL
jgi:hypothetical protein